MFTASNTRTGGQFVETRWRFSNQGLLCLAVKDLAIQTSLLTPATALLLVTTAKLHQS